MDMILGVYVDRLNPDFASSCSPLIFNFYKGARECSMNQRIDEG